MAELSRFFGIIISMFGSDHNPPHIHVKYQDNNAVIDMEGDIMQGTLPRKQLRLVQAWIEYRRDELMANWELAAKGDNVYKIDPL